MSVFQRRSCYLFQRVILPCSAARGTGCDTEKSESRRCGSAAACLVNELIRERSPQGEKGESGERMCKARKGRNERNKGREFR